MPRYVCSAGSAEVKRLSKEIIDKSKEDLTIAANIGDVKEEDLLASAHVLLATCIMREASSPRDAVPHLTEAEVIRPHFGQKILKALSPLTEMFEDSDNMKQRKFKTKEELEKGVEVWNNSRFSDVIENLLVLKKEFQAANEKAKNEEKRRLQWEINELYTLVGRLQGSASFHKKAAKLLRIVAAAMENLPKKDDQIWKALNAKYLCVISEVNDVFTDDKVRKGLCLCGMYK